MVPSAQLADQRRGVLARTLAELGAMNPGDQHGPPERVLFVEAILEAEAVVTVVLAIIDIKEMSERQLTILSQPWSRKLYAPGHMNPGYADTLAFVSNSMRTVF